MSLFSFALLHSLERGIITNVNYVHASSTNTKNRKRKREKERIRIPPTRTCVSIICVVRVYEAACARPFSLKHICIYYMYIYRYRVYSNSAGLNLHWMREEERVRVTAAYIFTYICGYVTIIIAWYSSVAAAGRNICKPNFNTGINLTRKS